MENQFSDGLIRISLHHSILNSCETRLQKRHIFFLLMAGWLMQIHIRDRRRLYEFVVFVSVDFSAISHRKEFWQFTVEQMKHSSIFSCERRLNKKLRAELCFALSNWHLSLSFPRAQHGRINVLITKYAFVIQTSH